MVQATIPGLTNSLISSVSKGVEAPIQEFAKKAITETTTIMQTTLDTLQKDFGEMQKDVGEIRDELKDLNEFKKEMREEAKERKADMQQFRAMFASKSDGDLLHPTASHPIAAPIAAPIRDHQPTGPETAADISERNFFRAPDKSKLFANMHEGKSVPMVNFRKAFDKLAEEANLSADSYTIKGDNLDERFTIIFNGDATTAGFRSSQFMVSLRLAPGKFKEQKADDPQGVPTQIYFNPDKNGAQVRKEVLAKALVGILAKAKPDKSFFLKRDLGQVLVDKRPLALVIVTGETGAKLSWMHSKRIALGIDQPSIEAEFAAFVAKGREQWS